MNCYTQSFKLNHTEGKGKYYYKNTKVRRIHVSKVYKKSLTSAEINQKILLPGI